MAASTSSLQSGRTSDGLLVGMDLPSREWNARRAGVSVGCHLGCRRTLKVGVNIKRVKTRESGLHRIHVTLAPTGTPNASKEIKHE